jgi:hypothetical protein
MGALVVACVTLPTACSSTGGEWLDARSVDPSVRADYEVFAIRCSKCHSLARPLNSGIDRDDYWRWYVARMRRQPGSGITESDTVAILRFLHVYSLDERQKKAQDADPGAPPATSASSATPAPPPSSVPAPLPAPVLNPGASPDAAVPSP